MILIRKIIPGTRYDCITNKSKEVELVCIIEKRDDDKIVFSIEEGGVTRYESFIIEDDTIERMKRAVIPVWTACWGTKGKWDKLDVPLKGIIEMIEKIPEKTPMEEQKK